LAEKVISQWLLEKAREKLLKLPTSTDRPDRPFQMPIGQKRFWKTSLRADSRLSRNSAPGSIEDLVKPSGPDSLERQNFDMIL